MAILLIESAIKARCLPVVSIVYQNHARDCVTKDKDGGVAPSLARRKAIYTKDVHGSLRCHVASVGHTCPRFESRSHADCGCG